MRAPKKVTTSPVEALKCAGCGFEIPVMPVCGPKLTCGQCGAVNDRAMFVPVQKTLWVEKKAKSQLSSEKEVFPKCTCIGEYRKAARFRRAIFKLSESQGQIAPIQAVAMLVAFLVDSESGIVKLLEGEVSNSSEKSLSDLIMYQWLAQIRIKNSPRSCQ